jgi:hypothetical protein
MIPEGQPLNARMALIVTPRIIPGLVRAMAVSRNGCKLKLAINGGEDAEASDCLIGIRPGYQFGTNPRGALS